MGRSCGLYPNCRYRSLFSTAEYLTLEKDLLYLGLVNYSLIESHFIFVVVTFGGNYFSSHSNMREAEIISRRRLRHILLSQLRRHCKFQHVKTGLQSIRWETLTGKPLEGYVD